MPQIPIPQKPRLARTGDNSVRLSGAPDLNWNVDHGLARMGESIGHAAQNIGSAVLRYAEESAEAENTLAAAEAERIQRDGDNKLDERIAANPGAYEQYGEWARETDAESAEKLRPVLGRMTEKFRRGYEERMLIRRQQAVSERVRLGNLARSKAQLQAFDAEFLEAARRGDAVTAEFMLARETGRLFGQEGADERRKQFDQVSSGYAARAMVDTGTPDAVERLEARNEDGSYKEYPHMEQGYRDQLVRYAERKRAQYEVGQMDSFVADVLAGKAVSEDSVLQRTDIRQGMKNDFIKILRSVQSIRAKQQTEERKQARRYARDAFEFEIMEYRFSPDPVERDKQFAAFNRRICTEFAADDPAYAKQLKTQLNESLKAAMKPDTSYKKTAVYQYGENLINQMAAQGKFFASTPGTLWGTNKTTRKADEPIRQYTEKLVRRDLDNYLRNHPNATEKEVREVIEVMTEDYNKTLVDELAERSIVHSRANMKIIPKEGLTGNYNGKKVIFKDGKWDYAE